MAICLQPEMTNPLQPRNVLYVLDGVREVGLHSFRWFRRSVLRKASVPEILIQLWLGHAGNLTDRYAQQRRQDRMNGAEWAERAGVGFDVDTLSTQHGIEMRKVKVA